MQNSFSSVFPLNLKFRFFVFSRQNCCKRSLRNLNNIAINLHGIKSNNNNIVNFLDAAAATTQVQINPQTGQPDYSKQWAEYYRSLGMHREADMIEQQAKAGGAAAAVQAQPAATTVAPVAGQQPAAGQPTANGAVAASGAVPGAAQPDYSAQWAEYYRSIGKIKEAEAIEAQMKSKSGAVAPGGMATSTAAVSVAGSVVTSTPSAPVQATAVTAAPGQPFAGYANYGGW